MSRHFSLPGAHSPLMLAGHLIAIGLALVLIIALSRYERRLVSRSLGWGLLGLRLSVLAVILLTLLQPTLSWTLEQSQTSRILVGIDLSDSMATLDRHASRGEKLRVARGLELIGNAAHEARLNRWQQAFDADQQPVWVDPDEAPDEERRAALEASRRDNLKSLFDEVEKLPRREIARRLLTGTNSPLLDQLAQVSQVDLFAFAGKSEAVDREQLPKIVAEPPASLQTDTTDLSLGLQWGASGTEEIKGIVLFTDGRDHAGQNLVGLASALKASHTPVYPVLIGSRYRPKDLSILLVEHPQTVYKGDHPQIKVTLGTVGFDGQSIDVELVSEDQPDAPPVRQTVICKGASTTIDFQIDAEETGRKKYVVRTSVQPGETRDDNNSRSFSLMVVDDRAQVFLVDGEARWEFRYLDAAFSRDERVNLKRVLFDQPYLGILPGPFFPRRLTIPTDAANPAVSPTGKENRSH